MNLSYRELLKSNPDFRLLFLGQLVSELGNWFNYIAGLGLIRIVSDASPEAAGVLLLCRTLPWALLMPFAGTFADLFSRKQIMILTDFVRALLALVFLFVDSADDLWLAYTGSLLLSAASAFFDGAKNAAVPNIAGKEGLLSATALMFSSRFLFMAVGAALGGVVSTTFGYEVAFIINSISFTISALSIILIPENSMHGSKPKKRDSFFDELKEGFRYTLANPFALTILLMNIIWAMGGGATFLVFEGLAVQVFSLQGKQTDFVVSFLMTANGVGLTLGMLIAHRIGSFVESKKIEISFIGWTLVLHGILFALAGLTNSLWLSAFLVMLSRTVVGVEYAVQETMFQRSLPDYIRGRISTLDRGAEVTVFSLASYLAGVSLNFVSATTLAILAGFFTSSSGVFWFARMKNREVEVLRYS
jgi:predicted MFS family arabinose efflux permease